jgi:beta-N-acetylhexosaminidase
MNHAGRKVETIAFDERSTDEEVQKALERAKSADLVIASLYSKVRSGQARSTGLPQAGERVLSSLVADKTPMVAISFGNPYLLQSFPGIRTYLVTYGDMPSLQEATALAILGKIDIVGKLPISLPGLYPRGTGIQLHAVQRTVANSSSQERSRE